MTDTFGQQIESDTAAAYAPRRRPGLSRRGLVGGASGLVAAGAASGAARAQAGLPSSVSGLPAGAAGRPMPELRQPPAAAPGKRLGWAVVGLGV